MMSRRRKLHEASTKARVALEAVKERETVAQIGKRFGVHPTQVNQWKRKLLEEAAALFDRENGRARTEAFEATELYEQIGRLKMELDWLKKKAAQFAE
jgi:transposase-like protein